MAKGVKKTILEKQINIYNQFQYQNRQTDRLGLSRKQAVSVEEQIARNIEDANHARTAKTKQDQINAMLAKQPRYSFVPGMTAEDKEYWVGMETAWKKEYHQLLAELKK
jgi:hypothetical protein